MQASKVSRTAFRAMKSAPRRIGFILVCICGSLFLWTASAVAGQVAMVVDVQGKGTLHRASSTLPLDILMNLTGGEDMTLEDGARVTVVYLGSGDEFQATGPVRLAVEATRLQPRSGAQLVRRVSPLAGATSQFAATGGLIQGAVRMRSLGKAAVRLLAPQGRQMHPPAAFTWDAAQAGVASLYVFELSEQGSVGPALLSLETQAREITLPHGVELIAGRAYRWTLSFLDASGRRASLEGQFQIASPAESGQWQGLRPPPDAPLSDWVVYAGLLKEANFREDARAIWSDLVRRRPESAQLDALSRP